MNKSNLKRYAPAARRDFIAAVTQRAQLLGLSLGAGGRIALEPCAVQGDVAVIAGRAWPAKVSSQRDALYERMVFDGYHATLEAIAYTWFNRLAALRYMELHDYLGHGRRVLSHPEGGPLPEVLAHALDLAEAGNLPGLRPEQVRELKLANQDGELYRRALIAQCNALHQAMPFLFEALDDETELLLPDNLLLSDSIVAKLVAQIPEEDWAEVEAIGWLYQFYISEKKDEVIGKVVKSEDIPAATQLFTPNWIVQYLVQNSVGRLWLMANPTSTLASQWPYYIQPAEQTPEVQAQLDALIQTRIREDGEALNPESITVLDPACGSGHILVVAYDVLKAIYLERGYQPRAIPRLILEKNLYGLDIDDRAAQLAAFALLMKARADDRRLFNDPPKLNVLSLQESKGLDADELATHLAPFGLQRAALASLVDTFEHAKTFGSLIQIPAALNGQLAAMTAGLQQALQDGDLYARQAAKDVLPLVWQGLVLGMQFDAVVANPPYMGNKGMSQFLKDHVKAAYPNNKSDLFAAFIGRGFYWCKPFGFNSLVTMQSWMFLSSFEEMRGELISERTLITLAHLGARAFSEISGEVVQTVAFVFQASSQLEYIPSFFRLIDGQEDEKKNTLLRADNKYTNSPQSDFRKIPGQPIAYWVGKHVRDIFQWADNVGLVGVTKQGLATGDNGAFLRYWHEIPEHSLNRTSKSRDDAKASGMKWFPCNKGGTYRKWYGNNEYVVDWKNDGQNIRADKLRRLNDGLILASNSKPKNTDYYFKEGITWSAIATGSISMRYSPSSFMFETKGAMYFSEEHACLMYVMALSNSKLASTFLNILSPTLDFHEGPFLKMPLIIRDRDRISTLTEKCIAISKSDWDSFEESWDFQRIAVSAGASNDTLLSASFEIWKNECKARLRQMTELEEAINSHLIDTYGLESEISSDIPENQITLARADREKDCQRLISYAIGCMMGRYSLDKPGLIYAHAGNVGFDPSRYEKKFPADADGIVPITDERWFEDDAASRVREFLRAVWGADTLEENMAWLAESLGQKGSETPDETIRRYLADKFFKDHLQTYKKRPIYWLFSSGKQGAFQALVYLHRYHDGTLARLRAEYVLPLTGKMQSRIDSLQADIRAASSTAARTKLTKQLDKLKKQHLELLAYDEKLRHHADMRISLDLDDGVKVNYGKFGDLLAEVKAVTGGKEEE